MRAGLIWQERSSGHDPQAVLCIVPDTDAEAVELQGLINQSTRPDIAGVRQFIPILGRDVEMQMIKITLVAAETEA